MRMIFGPSGGTVIKTGIITYYCLLPVIFSVILLGKCTRNGTDKAGMVFPCLSVHMWIVWSPLIVCVCMFLYQLGNSMCHWEAEGGKESTDTKKPAYMRDTRLRLDDAFKYNIYLLRHISQTPRELHLRAIRKGKKDFKTLSGRVGGFWGACLFQPFRNLRIHESDFNHFKHLC